MPKSFKNNPLLDLTGYSLTFEDHFETLDYTKWKFNPQNDDAIRNCAFYVDDDDILFTENSCLTIRTKWKNGKYGEGYYTSWLESSKTKFKQHEKPGYNGFNQTYGYFEIRCKVPAAVGIWSAFWLMPDNDIAFSDNDIQFSGEDGLEFDIMESPHYYRFFKKDKNANIHVLHADGYDERLKSCRSPLYSVENMYTDFHTYGFLWEEDKYTFFIDSHQTWQTTHNYEGHEMGICKALEYIILSTEVAGMMENGKQYPGYVRNAKTNKLEKFWCGNPAKNSKNKNYDFVVDYVRVYKKD